MSEPTSMESAEIAQFSEAHLEQAIIEMFASQGYEIAHGNDINRGLEEVILREDLIAFLRRRYMNSNLTALELERAVNQIEILNAPSLYEASREAFRLITEGFDLQRDEHSQLAVHIDFIDFDNIDNNTFKVVNQFIIAGERNRRPDLLLFINGIPVSIFEFKSAISEDATVYDAWEQITIRYARDIPKLLKYTFLAVISDGANTRMGSVFTGYKFFYSWNRIDDDTTVAGGISALVSMIEGAFSKQRILAILRDFIFYPDNSIEQEAIVCRYPQFFGANKMLASIRDQVLHGTDGKGGTYFGATGCGKTYTMLYLSRLLCVRENAVFNNPTIIIITDREDLDTQASSLFVTAKHFLHENDVRSIESRADLALTLKNRPSGGVYITTIQKFCESIGLLSDRRNIICIADEAHRTQTSIEAKTKVGEDGVTTSYGFAKYLRDSFPNATYCGFTGTPIDETLAVFGDIVDSYTMKESTDDGITVRIAYEPRLARVIMSDEKAAEIQKYYDQCADKGSSAEQIQASKNAMSAMKIILGDDDRIKSLAQDITQHFENLTQEKPEVPQKAMIVCADRRLAYKTLQAILDVRPGWGEAVKSNNENSLSKEKLSQLLPLPKINMVATQGQNDSPELFALCGSNEHRKMLDQQFKNNDSNFQIAIVVDMWITGFDVPSLAVMYIDKPLQKHTLVQTISRVNRVFEGKDKGLVVDYFGIKRNMMEAMKTFGDKMQSPVDEISVSVGIFRNHLSLLADLLSSFNSTEYFTGTPYERLMCLNRAAEYVQSSKEMQTRFMGLSQQLKSAYAICVPTGELANGEVATAQFYFAIRSIIYKQTKGHTPDAEIMNEHVQKMVEEAITCTGIEDVISGEKSIDLFSDEFLEQLKQTKLPISKFNALLKMLKRTIGAYQQQNKVKAIEFNERLRDVVDRYNSRDKLVFTSEVVDEFVNELSEELICILRDLEKDKESFKDLGITYEEKIFYDILIKVKDTHDFVYAEEKCLVLAGKIKELVGEKISYTDWNEREDIKNELNMELTVLLYKNGYPPEWDEEIFEKVLEQAENFKKFE